MTCFTKYYWNYNMYIFRSKEVKGRRSMRFYWIQNGLSKVWLKYKCFAAALYTYNIFTISYWELELFLMLSILNVFTVHLMRGIIPNGAWFLFVMIKHLRGLLMIKDIDMFLWTDGFYDINPVLSSRCETVVKLKK